MRSRRGK